MAILVFDQSLNLEFANEKARELLDCESMDELTAWWSRSRGTIMEAVNDALEDKESSRPIDIEIPSEKKTHRLRLDFYPVEEEEHQGYVLLIHDRDQMDALETDLRLAARYRALSRLYGSMAHDLKAPLNALAINLDLLKTILGKYPPQDQMLGERQQRYVKVLGDELARLNRLLQNLLTQTLPPNEVEQPFELRDLILDLTSLIAPQAKRQQVAMEIQLDEQTLMLEGHRDTLKQALLNIAVNALEAMSGGGRLHIQLETRLGHAIISFHDSGPGLPQELADKIWEMHFTTKNTGTGIGLYVTRSVIESFGGTIRAEVRNGQGTCFVISLPMMDKEA